MHTACIVLNLYTPPSCAGLSPAADVYSFGIIMFEVYAGQMAFHGANLGHLIFQIGEFPGNVSTISVRLRSTCSQEPCPRQCPWQSCFLQLQCTGGSGQQFRRAAPENMRI